MLNVEGPTTASTATRPKAARDASVSPEGKAMKQYLSYIFVLLLISNVAFAADVAEPLWVGIVRIDGILVPIGAYKDKWVNAWPEVSIDEQPEVDKLVKATNGKVKLHDLPAAWIGPVGAIPTEIYLWSEKPSAKKLRVIDAEKFGSHCSGGWALRTDLQPTKEVDYAPTPKLGIATNINSNVTSFERLPKGNKLPSSIRNAIKAKFDKKYPVELTRVYKTRNIIKGGNLYFIEAQQKYPYSDKQFPDCYNLNSLNIWVMLSGDNISILSSEFIPTDCWGKESHDIIPYVVVSARRGHFVVSENHGYESEFYTVHELLDNGLKEVLSVDGGGC
jgi:hypothetical protein